MGAVGVLCVFDADRFVREVVPALARGVRDPWVDAATRSTFFDRARAYERGDFARLPEAIAELGAALDGPPDVRARVDSCCEHERLCALVEHVLVRECVSEIAVFPRRQHVHYHLSRAWNRRGVGDETERLVHLLGTRLALFQHGSGGYGEGLHGWLDGEETRELERGLATIEPDEDEDDMERALGDLDCIGVLVGKAVNARKGLLWGADLAVVYTPELFPNARRVSRI